MKHYEKNFLKNQLISKSELEKEIMRNKELAKKKNMCILFDEEKCNWLWSQIYVNYRGDVNPCCMILDPEEPKLGNILKQNFKEIWNNKEYLNLRHTLINKKVPSVCEGCRRLWKIRKFRLDDGLAGRAIASSCVSPCVPVVHHADFPAVLPPPDATFIEAKGMPELMLDDVHVWPIGRVRILADDCVAPAHAVRPAVMI